jgi:hypothetical protein
MLVTAYTLRMDEETKHCWKCRLPKTRGEYSFGQWNDPHGRCRKCISDRYVQAREEIEARVIARRAARPIEPMPAVTSLGASLVNRKVRLAKYGLTHTSYARLAKQQNYRCAVCGSVPRPHSAKRGERQLHIDHDHATGLVRGLLCASCNSAIGFLKDSPDIAHAVVVYLTEKAPA